MRNVCDVPEHPAVLAMERDGCLPERRGAEHHCQACGGGIFPGEKFYLVNDRAFCEDHWEEALEEAKEYA
jgi:hypothetical protein